MEPPSELQIYAELKRRYDSKGRNFKLKSKQVGNWLGINSYLASRRLEKLERRGLVKRSKQSPKYRVIWVTCFDS